MRWVNGWSIASLAGTGTVILTIWIGHHFHALEQDVIVVLFFVGLLVGVLTLPCAWVAKLMARVSWHEVPLVLAATDLTGIMGCLLLWFVIDCSTIGLPFLWFQPQFK